MRVLQRIRQAPSFPAVADLAIGGLCTLPGVVAAAVIGFDAAGHPALWIGDDRISPDAIRAFLAGGADPHEDLALARGGTLRAVPIAGSNSIAGVVQLVALGDQPSWSELSLFGAQVSARLAVLGVDTPLADHVAPPQLTQRQREIAWLVARGCTNAEIARMVGCSASTVKQQLSLLLERFDVSNRTELATIAASWSTTTSTSPARPIYLR